MQNVTIHGIVLQDRNVEDALGATARFLRNSALNLIAYIDYKVIRQTYYDDFVRRIVRSAAITEWSDPYLLETVGIQDPDRIRQVGERLFLKEELHSMTSGDRTVGLAADSDEALDRLEKSLLEIEPDLNIVIKLVLDPPDGHAPEDAINRINMCAPSMIVSHMDYHRLSEWIDAASSMINVGVWLALPDTMKPVREDGKGVISGIREFMRSRLLRVRLSRYKEV